MTGLLRQYYPICFCKPAHFRSPWANISNRLFRRFKSGADDRIASPPCKIRPLGEPALFRLFAADDRIAHPNTSCRGPSTRKIRTSLALVLINYRVEPAVLIRTAETLKIKRATGAFNF